ncbi:hypothetical protein OUZ56_015744 [Daphnia magna]|uniref:Uncharacterized protein n=1 Tax=Daphnia magna TaxID=35525 RepID=A0ABR0ANL5_9CRUS|nr:hypothetical protein OUZ56_015744 [Daphnia magna]
MKKNTLLKKILDWREKNAFDNRRNKEEKLKKEHTNVQEKEKHPSLNENRENKQDKLSQEKKAVKKKTKVQMPSLPTGFD